MVDTSYVDADNRRTWNSLIYSRFLVIGFHKGVDSIKSLLNQFSESVLTRSSTSDSPTPSQEQRNDTRSEPRYARPPSCKTRRRVTRRRLSLTHSSYCLRQRRRRERELEVVAGIEEMIRGKEGRGGRKKEEQKKDLSAQVYTYMKGVPPTLKVTKYIHFFVKKKRFFCNNELNAVMDNAAAK